MERGRPVVSRGSPPRQSLVAAGAQARRRARRRQSCSPSSASAWLPRRERLSLPRAVRGGGWLSPPASPDRVRQRNVDAGGAEAARPPRRRCRHDPVLGGAGDGAADPVVVEGDVAPLDAGEVVVVRARAGSGGEGLLVVVVAAERARVIAGGAGATVVGSDRSPSPSPAMVPQTRPWSKGTLPPSTLARSSSCARARARAARAPRRRRCRRACSRGRGRCWGDGHRERSLAVAVAVQAQCRGKGEGRALATVAPGSGGSRPLQLRTRRTRGESPAPGLRSRLFSCPSAGAAVARRRGALTHRSDSLKSRRVARRSVAQRCCG